ncbi:hypothetical protein QU760_23265, partial [Escherichia coli]|nr:hypothetical protein [Escherichia coli]
MNWLRHTYQETLFPGRTYPPETPLLSGLKFFGIYRTQKNADITDRLLSVPNSADPKAMYLREGANKQVISSQADSLIKISRIWAD